ncbi:molybdate ABC transporter substrate-binding protein [Gracilibacillus lacisalsi]|uniref:molybdate ABC transporter substrate-binding protein n=1 Tax=Gracilibacillus lacisalsi TaxID=393087 RepID=UPI00037E18AE|nr:molybdate ABC transporter substrate-binding protein [Gracilibacillus lacisalsi]
MNMKRLLYILLALILLTACQQEKEELTISAAASLTDALQEIVQQFEDENPHITVSLNLGGSGSLSQQIIQGAPADIFFSASVPHFERVLQEGLIEEESARALLANQLVWIQPQNVQLATTVESFDQMAIGTPETVPAGNYAKQALVAQGIYKEIEEQLIFTKDVRQVVQYVESNNVDAGIVYQTDAMISDKVQINETLPLGEHEPIIYPVGIIKDSQAVEAFYNYLQSEAALEIFQQYGFQEIDGDTDGSIFSTD